VALNAALTPIVGPNPTGKQVVQLIWKNLMGSDIPPSDIDNTNLVSQLGDLINLKVITAAQLVTFSADLDLTAQVIDLVGLSKTGWEYIPYGG